MKESYTLTVWSTDQRFAVRKTFKASELVTMPTDELVFQLITLQDVREHLCFSDDGRTTVWVTAPSDFMPNFRHFRVLFEETQNEEVLEKWQIQEIVDNNGQASWKVRPQRWFVPWIFHPDRNCVAHILHPYIYPTLASRI